MPKINHEILKNCLIPLPPNGEQKRLVSKILQVTSLCNRMHAQFEVNKKQAEQILQTLLRDALKPNSSENSIKDEEQIHRKGTVSGISK
jgi:restriction endonuclease S subunit